MPSFMNCTDVLGLSSRLTPPTRAASHWPLRMAWKAFSKASRLEEQAVSMAVLGPGGGGGGGQGYELSVTWLNISQDLHQTAQVSVCTQNALLSGTDELCVSVTVEVEEIGDPVGQHGPLAAGHAVAQQLLWVSAEGLTGLRAAHADVDARLTAPQGGGVQACSRTAQGYLQFGLVTSHPISGLTSIHDGLISNFQQEAELGIHGVGLFRMDSEKCCVKMTDVLQFPVPLWETVKTWRSRDQGSG